MGVKSQQKNKLAEIGHNFAFSVQKRALNWKKVHHRRLWQLWQISAMAKVKAYSSIMNFGVWYCIKTVALKGDHRDELAIGLLLGGLSLHWLLTISPSAYSQYFFHCIFTIFGHKSKLGRTAVDISSRRTSAAILQNNTIYMKSFNRKKSAIAYFQDSQSATS